MCKSQKELGEFYKHSKCLHGVSSQCKSCSAERLKLRRKENPLLFRKKGEKYRKNNKDRISAWHKQYRKDNPEKVRQTQKTYYSNNKVKILEQTHQYYLNNKTKIQKTKYKRRKERLKNDPLFRMADAIRRRTYYALKSKKFHKTNDLTGYLGCSIGLLKQHLENQFEPEMNWTNHGKGKNKWTIDHIIPLSSSKTPEELYKLCHYTNLQPMWYLQNLRKNAKMP